MPLEFYNTKTRKKEKFKPLKQDITKIYYCGPTVYNYAHIGNLRAYIFEDIIVKTLRFLGFKPSTLMNITDIDDKTIRDSIASGEKLSDFTKKYTKIFLEDIEKLGIDKADKIVPISELIPEMVKIINGLLKRGFAYISDDGSIYFEIKKFKKYGEFANIDFSGMKESVRVDNDEYEKDTASDFVLWKAYKESDGENFWEEKFIFNGEEKILKGRPGWHIECSACNLKYFGPKIDIHMGGVDLIFPHHQNEIAQMEAYTGNEFSNYWLHSGHLMVENKKMAKSAGNFYTLKDLEEKFSSINKSVLYRAIRLSYINGKYRDNIDFSFSKLEQFFSTINRIDETLKKLNRLLEVGDYEFEGVRREFRESMQVFIMDYIEKLEDDVNTPEALAVFFDYVTFVNVNIDSNGLSEDEAKSLMDMFKTLNEILGIIDFDILEEKTEINSELEEIFNNRNEAKKNKDFETADKLRDELLNLGYKIIDDRSGSRLEKI